MGWLRRHNRLSAGCRHFAMSFATIGESCEICDGYESHREPEQPSNLTVAQLMEKLITPTV